MTRVTIAGAVGLLGLFLFVAGGCGGSAFSASGSAGAPSNGGSATAGDSAASGAAQAGGVPDTGGATSSAGKTSSGGAATSAGESSGGGNNGSAGDRGSAGSSACVSGTLTFKLTPAKDSAAAAYCTGCSRNNWVSVTDSNGKDVALDRSCSVADCSACQPSACPPMACFNGSVPPEGLTRDWDEAAFADSTCGVAALSCAAAHCVPPGKYKAKMCAFKNTTPDGTYCSTGSSTACTEVDFELPGATVVEGVISG